jgi:hypothetical protein
MVINTEFDKIEVPTSFVTTEARKEIPGNVSLEKVEAIRNDIEAMLETARSLVIANENDYRLAGGIGLECTTRIKKVESELEESRAAADTAHKAITRLITKLTTPYKQIKYIVAQKADAWDREEKRRCEVEAERLRRIEQKRLDDERLAAAERAKAVGNDEMADAILEQEVIAPTVKVERPKIEGVSHRENWQAEQLPGGFILLVKAVAEGKAPATYLQPNEAAIRAQAKSLKSLFNVPGFRAYDAGTTAFRG